MGWLKPPQLCAGRQMILAWSRLVALGAELSEMRQGFRLHGFGLGYGGWEAVKVAFLEHNDLQSLQSLIFPQEGK